MAGRCLASPDPQAENVAQLLAYLGGAICQLEAARGVVGRPAT